MNETRKVKFFRELIASGCVLEGLYAEDAAELADQGWL